MRIAGDAVHRRLRGRAHRKFIEVEFANDDAVFRLQSLDDVSVVRGLEILQHATAAGRGRVLAADVVLDGQRQALQQTERFPGRAAGIDGVRGRPGVVRIHTHKRVEFRILLFDAAQRQFHQRATGGVAGGQLAEKFGGGQRIRVVRHNYRDIEKGRRL